MTTMDIKIIPLYIIWTSIIYQVVLNQRRYKCNNDARWPEFTYTVNNSCVRCPKNCETCLPETDDLLHPCRKCFEGHGFEPSPNARQMLDNSTRLPVKIGSSNNSDNDKQQHNDTAAEIDDPFKWFVGGLCEDCLTIGKFPTFANNRLRLTPASQFTPYEGRLEVYYAGTWWAVCDDLWNMTNTHVACWELGLGLGVSFYYEYYQMPPSVPLDPIPIAFDNVQCQPDETSLFRCKRSQFLKHNCDMSETLGIKCSGPRHNSICVTQCPVGQWLDPAPTARVCKPCSENCLQCQSDPTVCTTCEENKYLAVNKSCVTQCLPGLYADILTQTCQSCDFNCVTCRDGSRNNSCLSCAPNMVLYETSCINTCPENSYWIQLESAFCLAQCPQGYFVSGSQCEQCQPQCKTCTGKATNCTLCNQPQVLMLPGFNNRLEGSCVNICDRGYYPNPDFICKVCKQLSCDDCYLGGDYCKTCGKDFKRQFHVCVSSCDSGLFNNSGICTESCQPGYYGDHISRSCMPCVSPCKQCIQGVTCSECFQGRHLDKGKCVESCQNGHIAVSMDTDSNKRLVGKTKDFEGYVQVWRNNSWAFLCVDSMTIQYGQKICESLSFGNILQISHQVHHNHIALYVYFDNTCFKNTSYYNDCLYNSMYSVCTKQVPFLRCQGYPIGYKDKCVQLNPSPCITNPCSNVTNCYDVSYDNDTSYCESCPNGYKGDGIICEKVILGTNKIMITFPPTNIQLLNWPEGLELRLPCVVNKHDLVNLQWYKDGMQLFTDKHKRLETSGTLILFQPVGLQDSGLYMCMVLLHNEVVTSRTYNITVQEKIKIVVPPTDFMGSGLVILNCVYKGYPSAIVSWNKDRELINQSSPDYNFVSNGSLIILSAQPNHSGLYQCNVRNEFTQDSAYAYVNITGAPVIIDKFSLVGAALGKELKVICKASGGPVPDIYWKKNGKDIAWDDRIKVINGNTLVITIVEAKDAGIYKCIARNRLGEDVWNTNVTVMDFPNGEITELYEEASIGDIVSFICVSSTSWPPPVREWHLPGRGKFTASNRTTGIQIIDDKILIGSIEEKDSGNITCTLSNPAGSVSLVAHLLVRIPPRFIRAPQNTTLVDSWFSHLPWTVYAIPSADIKWEHPPGIRLNGRSGYTINENGLYFTPTWPDSEGIYQIFATNDEGLPLLGGAYIHIIKTFVSIPKSDLTITGSTISIPITDISASVSSDIVDIIVTNLGNETGHNSIKTSPYNIPVEQCSNKSDCNELLTSRPDIIYRSGIMKVPTTQNSYFVIGDNGYYSVNNVYMYNPSLKINSWYAIGIRYFKTIVQNDQTISHKMVAAFNFTYVYTEDPVPSSSAWKIILPLVLVLILIIVILLIVLYILHKKGSITEKTRYFLRCGCLCKAEEGFNLDGSPIDVQSYLPQFSPNPSPTHIKQPNKFENNVSAVYIPTEDEIEHMMAIGINYYDDENWIIQVPEGILELSVEKLNSMKEGRRNQHKKQENTWRKLPNLPESGNNKEQLCSDTNTKKYNNIPSTSGIYSNPVFIVNEESSLGSGSVSAHQVAIHSPSSGSESGADSGFNEVLPRSVSLSSKRGQNLAREVVNIMKLRHQESTVIKQNDHKRSMRISLTDMRDKLTYVAEILSNGMRKLQNSLNKSKRTLTLEHEVDLTDRRRNNFKIKRIPQPDIVHVKNDIIYLKRDEQMQYKGNKPPAVARRKFLNDNSSESDGEEYIDPTSIVSIPKLTARMKELKDHNKVDRPPTPKILHSQILNPPSPKLLQQEPKTKDNRVRDIKDIHDKDYALNKSKSLNVGPTDIVLDNHVGKHNSYQGNVVKTNENREYNSNDNGSNKVQEKRVVANTAKNSLNETDNHDLHLNEGKINSKFPESLNHNTNADVEVIQHEEFYEVPVKTGSNHINQSVEVKINEQNQINSCINTKGQVKYTFQQLSGDYQLTNTKEKFEQHQKISRNMDLDLASPLNEHNMLTNSNVKDLVLKSKNGDNLQVNDSTLHTQNEIDKILEQRCKNIMSEPISDCMLSSSDINNDNLGKKNVTGDTSAAKGTKINSDETSTQINSDIPFRKITQHSSQQIKQPLNTTENLDKSEVYQMIKSQGDQILPRVEFNHSDTSATVYNENPISKETLKIAEDEKRTHDNEPDVMRTNNLTHSRSSSANSNIYAELLPNDTSITMETDHGKTDSVKISNNSGDMKKSIIEENHEANGQKNNHVTTHNYHELNKFHELNKSQNLNIQRSPTFEGNGNAENINYVTDNIDFLKYPVSGGNESPVTEFLLLMVNESLIATGNLLDEVEHTNKVDLDTNAYKTFKDNETKSKETCNDHVKKQDLYSTEKNKRRFTITDTYRNKPPQRLKIPDVFKNN